MVFVLIFIPLTQPKSSALITLALSRSCVPEVRHN
jgi:hypothetical protein